MARTVLAGILGGLVCFVMGAVGHMFLDLESRHFRRVSDETAAKTFVDTYAKEPGIYAFPFMVENYQNLGTEQREKEMARVAEEFERGPAAYVIVAPRGEAMMGPTQLGGEALFDCLAGLFAAWIVSQSHPQSTLLKRWAMVMAMAAFGWFTLTGSYGLWYRFDWGFVSDGLFCAFLEWGLAGLVIAILVRPRPAIS